MVVVAVVIVMVVVVVTVLIIAVVVVVVIVVVVLVCHLCIRHAGIIAWRLSSHLEEHNLLPAQQKEMTLWK
jgi:hypothetical protein